MSWLGGSLSTFTDQISSLTKDILTEGTEEVDDPGTELKLAQARIKELEALLSAQKTENERVKVVGRELEEKADAAEFQVNSISREYRALLQEKETEIKELKARHHAMLEDQMKTVLSPQSPQQGIPVAEPFRPIHDIGVSENIPGDEHEFGDSISMQHDINRLSKEVQRLQSQCVHWKRMAAEAGGTSKERPQEDDSAEISHLKAEIKSLQHELSSSQERLQQEVAALQDHHRSQLATMKRKHQAQVEELQQEGTTLTDGTTETPASSVREVSALQQEVQALKEETKHLQQQLQTSESEKQMATQILTELETRSLQMKEKSAGLAQTVSRQEQELSALQAELSTLQSEHSNLQSEHSNLQSELSTLQSERSTLQSELSTLQSKRSTLQSELSTLQSDRSPIQSELSTLQSQLYSLHSERSSLQKNISTLQDSLQMKETELQGALGEVERLKGDNKQKSELLQELSTKDKSQKNTEEINEMVDSMAHQQFTKQTKEEGGWSETDSPWDMSVDDGTLPVTSTPHVKGKANKAYSNAEHVKHLSSQLEVCKEQIEEFECEKADWMVEKEALEDVLLDLRKQLKKKESVIESAKPSTPPEIESLKTEKLALEKQLYDVQQELEEERDEKSELLQNANQSTAAMAELESMRRSMSDKEFTVTNLISEKEELEASLQELDQQHNEAMAEVIRIRNGLQAQNDELKQKLTEKQSEILNLTSEVDDLRASAADSSLRQEQEASENLSDISLELQKMKKDHQQLEEDKQAQSSELESLVEKLNQSAKELEETRSKLTGVKHEREEAERAYRDTMEKLELAEQRLEALEESTAFDSGTQEHLEEELESLKFQLNESLEEGRVQKVSFQELQIELENSQEELASLRKGQVLMEQRLKENENSVVLSQSQAASSERSIEAPGTENQLLKTRVEALKSEKEALEKELNQSEQKLHNQHKNYENYIQELQKTQQLDTSGLQEEHKKSVQVCHEKEVRISHLEEQISSLREELSDSKETMQAAVDSQQQLSSLVNEKETEILELRRENMHLVDKIEEHQKHSAELKQKVTELEEMKTQLDQSKTEVASLKSEMTIFRSSHEESSHDSDRSEARTLDLMTDLESELRAANERVNELEEEISGLSQVVTDQETGIRELNNKTHQQGKIITDLEGKVSKQDAMIAVLQQSGLRKDSEISAVKSKYRRATSLIEPEKLHILDQPEASPTAENLLSLEYPEKGTIDLEETEVSQQDRKYDNNAAELNGFDKTNGRLSQQWSEESDSVTAEIEKLQKIIKDKDSVIEDLQTSNSSFLKMLESKALTSSGDRTMVDVHKLENEVRSLKMEREQILAVMNEKSRESSNLKSEVHRLMNIISAEKTALDKLTKDNNHLIHKRESSPDEDMQKEAVQNLSRIIRDKDLEIDSLTQKNQTLLQVLQDNSQDGTQITSLMQDKENLSKQLTMLQAEKEQMITFVNQKHQESVAYHNEVQRLTAYINSETEKFEKIQNDYANLVPQFEDNKQALLKAQNELINYKQKYSELEVKYGGLVQKSNVTDTVDRYTYELKAEEAKKLQERLMQCQNSLQSKEAKINSLNQRISAIELSSTSLEAEKNNYKKQMEHLSFQMQSLHREVEVVRQDSLEAEKGKSESSSELQSMREANDRASMSIREKEFEINMLKEKCATLTEMLQQRKEGGEGEKAQLDKLLRDNEAANNQARTFQQERDQLMVVLRQRQTEVDQLKEQVKKCHQKETKLKGELDRLRNHLLQIEEGYTQEALAAEDREKELRNRLAVAEEKLLSSSAAVEDVNLHASQQLESLQQQLMMIGGQRDAAYHQVAALQEQCQQYNASLANLQLVLEQFQQDRESTLATETDRYRQQISQLSTEVARFKKQLAETEAKLEEASDGLDAASRLSEQLDRKEAMIQALRDEVQLREKALKASDDEKKQLATTSEAKVDKILVKNLLVGYLSTPEKKRNEALRVIGVVLNFNHEDFHKVMGGVHTVSWVPGFLRFGRTHPSPPTTPTRGTPVALNKSFSELFVKFLEKESSPPPVMHLPAEKMAEETQQRHRDKERERESLNQPPSPSHAARPSPPQFNPFTAPRHAVMPIQVGGRSSPHDSHLLMSSSLSPTLPTFTPLAAGEGGGVSIAPGNPLSQTPGGRTTPTTSSAILKDVLGSR